MRWRCSSPGCQQSWQSYQAQRLLNHAIEECNFISSDLQERAAEQSASISLGEKVAQLDRDAISSIVPTKDTGGSQSSVRDICTKEGQRDKQVRFDFSVINFVCAAQLAPRKVDLPEFRTMISTANTYLTPKSSSYIAHCQIPMESSRIRRLALAELNCCRNLTISFDGGTAIRPMSFTTIHVTTPETREAHWMKGVEASGVSHTGDFYFKELVKAMKEIGPQRFSGITCDSTGNTRLARTLIHKTYPTIIMLPDLCHQLHNTLKDICGLDYFAEVCIYCIHLCLQSVIRYFSKSIYGATHLNSTCQHMDISGGFESAGQTRFGGWYYCVKSVRRRLPAIEKIVHSGVLEVEKDHTLYFIKNVAALNKFKTELYQLEKVLEPLAKATKCLESSQSHTGDVMIFYLAVMSAMRELVDNNESELSLPPDILFAIQQSICSRYYDMVLASEQEVYLSTLFLDPEYLNCDIFRRRNLNPLNTGVIVLPRRQPEDEFNPDPDTDLYRTFPSFLKIGLYLKNVLCREIAAGTIDAAKSYPKTPEGVDTIIKVFKPQLAAYARGEYPFVAQNPAAAVDTPMKYWKRLSKNSGSSFLAPVAVKLFSLVSNSMAEERTVSCFTKLNSSDRSRQKVSTLVHMTRIRQHLLRGHRGSNLVTTEQSIIPAIN
ncbi:hypothetical protein BDV93DRAFT_444591 [Ceratobasidium sp. AG-I]|nr:hypothetical protein BDV93DRAFT_444591 [Ceratobasidium sp. AG-I]